ncbi:hypothetical protein [Paraburkholderia ribeironis]|uniref:hypothetical protein n=1 Tax=Paraburkholderia ribeironis TaxID=1247936 RepID=UPI000B9D53D4|nr:hypothetical protein [Paraburkholderia ribeironis]
MDKLLRCGTLLVCLGFAAPALAQTYDEPPELADSTNCRAIFGQVEIDGTMQQVVGRMCQQSDGTWQIVQREDGSVLWYPVSAYPYPGTWWWGPPIFVGTGVIFVNHFHHFHHFDHFHQKGHDHFAPIGGGFHRAPFPDGGMRGVGGMRGFGGMHRH